MNNRIPTIVGIFALVLAVAAGVFVVQKGTGFNTGAALEKAPREVTISNISEDSFAVLWKTDIPTIGFLSWGETASLGRTAHPGGAERLAHYVTVNGQGQSSDYFFNIVSGGQVFNDSEGKLWRVSVGPELPPPSGPRIVSGSVVDIDGSAVEGAVVILSAKGVAPLSTLTSQGGNWVIPVSSARTESLGSYANLDENTKLDIKVIAPDGSEARAEALLSTAPMPPIELGKVHNFTSPEDKASFNLPRSSLQLPAAQRVRSAFNTSPINVLGAQKKAGARAAVESINEGETVYSVNPEFFGSGPAGETITVTVESEPITQKVKVNTDGSWRWIPPKNLEEGEHKITVIWRDASGFLRSATKNFVVSAQEGLPAFEATGSATPAPTLPPTPTPTSTASPSATPAALPDTGLGVPTIAGIAVGVVLILGALLLAL